MHFASRAVRQPSYGLPSGEIDLAVVGTTEHIERKRAAIAAHASQVPAAAVDDSGQFTAAYGVEWFVRTGAPAALDLLTEVAPCEPQAATG